MPFNPSTFYLSQESEKSEVSPLKKPHFEPQCKSREQFTLMKMCVKVFLEWDEPRINVTYNISLGGTKNECNSICQGNLLKGIENKIVRIEAFRKLQSLLKYFPQNIQKSSEQFLKKFSRFWKYPIPYIVLRGWKPFRACYHSALILDYTTLCNWVIYRVYYKQIKALC